MSLEEVEFELKRAIFWVKKNPINKSILLINEMEKRKKELTIKI